MKNKNKVIIKVLLLLYGLLVIPELAYAFKTNEAGHMGITNAGLTGISRILSNGDPAKFD